MIHARRGLLFWLPLVLMMTGCAGRGGLRGTPRAPDGDVGVYRVHAEDPAGRQRRFKLILWAAAPDRLHGEIVSPVGTTVLILDGGAGNFVVNVVRERLAFSGPGEAEALGRLFGVRISLGDLVTGLLTGEGSAADHRVVRRPDSVRGLPERLEISDGERSLLLELRQRRRLPATADVGHGRPMAGFDVRPLESLELYDLEFVGPGNQSG